MNKIENHVAQILQSIGEDPAREGLRNTPKRYATFLSEFTKPTEFTPTLFGSEGYDEMVVQTNITFFSLCEHHLLPFFGTGTIAYIPNKNIIGLSKLARMLDHYSHRLQNQERITAQVADRLAKATKPKGVGVSLTARHMCMEMRGISKPNTHTTTTAVRGLFKTNSRTRAEFLHVAKGDIS